MKTLLTLSFLFFSGTICYSQVDEVSAKQSAESAARKAKFGPSTLLHIWRREDLEEDLFNSQLLIKGQITRAAYFFQITTNGSFVISSNEVTYVTSTGYNEKHVVAVSARTGKVFLLSGFDGAVNNFNALAVDARLRIDEPAEAVLLSYFFFQVTFDPDEKVLVFTSLDLKHKIEEFFALRSAEIKAATSFKSWWKGYERRKLDDSMGVKATKQGDHFGATIAHTSWCPDNSLIRQLQIEVFRAGRIVVNADVQLYPIGKGTVECSSMLDW